MRAAGPAGMRDQALGAVVSSGLALAWLGFSWWHPTVTYHFGPPLAAAAWPVAVRARLRQRASRQCALVAVCGGFLAAMAALGIAVAEHLLRGPTLIGRGSVSAEEVILAVVAGAYGWRVAERRRRPWFMPAEPEP